MEHGQGRGSGAAEQKQTDARPEQGGQHAVRQVFGHAFHTGPRHAVGVERGRLATHDHGYGPTRAFEVVPGQGNGHAVGVFAEAARGKADVYQRHRRKPARARTAAALRRQDHPPGRGGGRQGRQQAGQRAGQKHPRAVGPPSEQGFHAGGERADQAYGVQPGRRFPEQTVDQQRRRQQRKRGEVHANPRLR